LPGTQILLHNEEGEFSRGKGLQVGALKMAKMHELLFFCDVDIVFDEQTLRRIRYETKQVRYSAYEQIIESNLRAQQYIIQWSFQSFNQSQL